MGNTETYDKDGRASLGELYARYDELTLKYGFEKRPIYMVSVDSGIDQSDVTVYCYRSNRKGPALWILSGVHGEEPAGPNAIAQNIDNLGELGQEIPLIVMPLLNPKGYCKNWRYPDERQDWRVGHSVSASEHYLLDLQDSSRPRTAQPGSEIAAAVTKFVLDLTVDYPPVLCIDHHEDDEVDRGYVYSQGHQAAEDEAAKEVIRVLAGSGMPIQTTELTRFGESIKDGVVVGADSRPVQDGSVDELLAAEMIIVAGVVVAKPGARTALVIETPTTTAKLDQRIAAHSNVLKRLRVLWSLATN